MFQIDESLIEEIYKVLNDLEEIYKIKNDIDESLRNKFYEKVHQLPNSDEIISEFERVFARDVNDNPKVTESVKVFKTKPRRNKRDVKNLPPPVIEKNKTCVEVFADFGAFFNKSISKFGFKYCSETEIVRRNDQTIEMANFGEKKEEIGQ